MKKLLLYLCILCLAVGLTPALAEEPSPIYTLVSVDAQGEATPLGTAALVNNDSTLIAPAWAAQAEGTLCAVGSGGTLAIAEIIAPCEGTGLRLLTLQEPSPAVPLTFGAAESAMTIVAATPDGLAEGTTGHMTLTVYEQDAAMLFTGMESMLPGAMLLNSQGQLAGLAVAGYGEGLNRYVAYPADVLRARMAGEAPAGAAQTNVATQWLTGLTATVDKGIMTVDWSGCRKPEEISGALTMIWEIEGNPYYSYAPIVWEDSTAELGVLPGQNYRLWLQYAPGGDADHTSYRPAEASTSVTVPQPEPFTAYSFKDVDIYLGAMPADEYEAGVSVVPPMATFTLESLTQPDTVYCMQVEGTYQVTEDIEANMLLVIAAPDGSLYTEITGYIFKPELNESDVWNVDVTLMLHSAIQYSGEAKGEYVLSYYLDGQLATEYRFTVE